MSDHLPEPLLASVLAEQGMHCCSHALQEANSLRRTTQIVECNLLHRPAQGRVSSQPRTPTSLCDKLIYRKCMCRSPQRDTIKASYGLYAVSLSWINRVTYINRHCTDNLFCFGVNQYTPLVMGCLRTSPEGLLSGGRFSDWYVISMDTEHIIQCPSGEHPGIQSKVHGGFKMETDFQDGTHSAYFPPSASPGTALSQNDWLKATRKLTPSP